MAMPKEQRRIDRSFTRQLQDPRKGSFSMSKRTAKFALTMIALGFVLMFASVAPASAQDGVGAATAHEQSYFLITGGAAGIGRIGGSAVESMARQPEASGQINTAMILTAAFIEGGMLFAVVVGLMASL